MNIKASLQFSWSSLISKLYLSIEEKQISSKISAQILGVSGSASALSLSLIPGFFPQGHSRMRPKAYPPTPPFFKQGHLLSVSLWKAHLLSWVLLERPGGQYYMLTLDAIKAPQGKKTPELGQSRPAKGRGRKGWGRSPKAGNERPMPGPEFRGNAHPGSEQERKRHCADRGGSFPKPHGG